MGSRHQGNSEFPASRSTIARMTAAVVFGILCWISSGLVPPHAFTLTAPAYADGEGDLQIRFEETTRQYQRALTRFRELLAEKSAAGGQSDLRSSPVLLRQVRKCVELHRLAENLLKDSLRAESSSAAYESNLRTFNALPPVATAPLELAGGDSSAIYQVIENVLKQAARDEEEALRSEGESRAKFLDDLLKEVTVDPKLSGEGGESARSEEAVASGWDQSRFTSLYRELKSASRELREHSRDFLDRLDLLAGSVEAHHICEDPTLAYSFAGLWRDHDRIDVVYGEIFESLYPGLPFAPEQLELMEILPPNTDIPLEDQLAVAELQRLYREDLIVLAFAERELEAKSGGCDPNELRETGNRTAEPGQDPESGVDAGAETGTGPIDGGELRFQAIGSVVTDENLQATCSGGALSLVITSQPVFPDRVTSDGSYTINITTSWSSSGANLEEVDVIVAVFFLGVYPAGERITTTSGSRTFSWTFNGSQLDFNQPTGVITVQIVGGIVCAGGSTDELSATISQAYNRAGSN
ncbi:MAG: hypothetical protein HZB43_03490 [candidate division Zixibacteria bacterium]|nr:hypothetical protein [candidate division Zixibacteria bacterium]